MEQLIKITENNGQKAVSARELYKFLEVTERFGNWMKRQFQYGFIENIDYVGCKVFNTLANKELDDYALSIDCSKEISMLQKSDKGKQARKYFIEIEKQAKKPMSQIEILQHSVNLLAEQDKRITSVETTVKRIEAQTQTRPNYFTIVGYATLNGIECGLTLASSLGKKATAFCRKNGFQTEELPDPRFGRVKTYPERALKEVFENAVIN